MNNCIPEFYIDILHTYVLQKVMFFFFSSLLVKGTESYTDIDIYYVDNYSQEHMDQHGFKLIHLIM